MTNGEVTLSVILPTLGRPTLARAVRSVLPQLAPGDELVVVADPAGDTVHAELVCMGRRPPATILRQQWRDGRMTFVRGSVSDGSGNPQRDLGIQVARGTHLCFLDDDDVYTPGALTTMRAAARPDRVVVCRVRLAPMHGHRVIWKEPVLELDNVSGLGLVCPRVSGLPGWKGHPLYAPRGADYQWAADVCDLLGTRPLFEDHLVAVARPDVIVAPAAAPAGLGAVSR